jgi:hypothetical protein
VTRAGATAAGRPTPRRRHAGAIPLALLGAAVAGAAAPPPLEVGLISALVPVAGVADELALPLVVEIAAGEPASETDASSFRGEIRVILRSAAGEAQASFVQAFDLERRGPEGGDLAGLRLYAELRVAAGRYELEAAVRDLDTGAAGRAVAAFEAPADRDVGWLASPALIVDRRPGWRALRTSELPASDLPFPFLDARGAVFLPAAELEASDGATLDALALFAAPGRDYPFVAAELVDLADGTVHDLPVAVLSITPAAAPGLAVARLEIGPVGREGSYRVRLTAVRPDGTRASPFASGPTLRIAPARVADRLVESPAILAGSGAGALESGYLQVLARLAEAGPEAGAQALLGFERAALTPRRSARLAELRTAERRIFERLTARERPARAAILALHLAAIELAQAERDVWIYAQGRAFLGDLLRGEKRPSADERAFAADLLSLCDSAAALHFDSAHPLALLRQAIVLEGTGPAGRRRRRRASLARGVARRSSCPPACGRPPAPARRAGGGPRDVLRAARFAGSRLGARARLLGALVARTIPRQAQAARAVLEEGIQRLEAQPLHLQLAFYLDEANQSARSTAVVHRLPIALEGARPAARHLYALEPSAELEVVRQRVRAQADGGLVALRAALAATAKGDR